MDQESFLQLVRESLDHLQNRGYLATHPLAGWVRPGGGPAAGDALRRALLDTIEQIRPLGGGGSLEADWRRYRHLVLRHVEGQSLESIARTLGVSVRQASRDHQQAVAAIASLLRVRYDDAVAENNLPLAVKSRGELDSGQDAAPPSDQGLTALGDDHGAGLVDAIYGVIATLGTLSQERGVVFDIAASDTLPPIAIDRTMLRQALLNLLTYAVDVGVGTVVLRAHDSTRGITLRAVAEARRSPVTDRAEEAESRARELLATARHLLVEPGCRLETGVNPITDGTDGWQLFSVIFPPVDRSKILVVDDNPDVVALFRRFLHGQPYRLFQATSAISAARLAVELRPDVIILDVVIPTHDGWDILRQLRAEPAVRNTPVIVCSVLPERALAMSLGVADFLAKPVTRDRLIATLLRHAPSPVPSP